MQLCSQLHKAENNHLIMEMMALFIFLHQIMKVWLVQFTRLCKANKLSCKMTKPYKVAVLLCKVIELCNVTGDISFSAKSWQPCLDEILYILKFWNMVLLKIGYEENWLQCLDLGTRKVSCKDTQVCPKYKKYTKMKSPAWQVFDCKIHFQNVGRRQSQ